MYSVGSERQYSQDPNLADLSGLGGLMYCLHGRPAGQHHHGTADQWAIPVLVPILVPLLVPGQGAEQRRTDPNHDRGAPRPEQDGNTTARPGHVRTGATRQRATTQLAVWTWTGQPIQDRTSSPRYRSSLTTPVDSSANTTITSTTASVATRAFATTARRRPITHWPSRLSGTNVQSLPTADARATRWAYC
jgi:hypothetical protein